MRVHRQSLGHSWTLEAVPCRATWCSGSKVPHLLATHQQPASTVWQVWRVLSGQWSMAVLSQQSYQGNENRRGCLKVEIKCRKKKGLYTPCRSRGKVVLDFLSLDLKLHLLFVKGFSRGETVCWDDLPDNSQSSTKIFNLINYIFILCMSTTAIFTVVQLLWGKIKVSVYENFSDLNKT